MEIGLPTIDNESTDTMQDRTEILLDSPRPSATVSSFNEVSPTSISSNSNDHDRIGKPQCPVCTNVVKEESKDKENTLSEKVQPPSLKNALKALLALKPGNNEVISEACNTIERAMYGSEPTEQSIAQIEPVLVKVLMRHVSSTEAHITLLEVLRKLCSIGLSLKSPQFIQSIMRVLRANKHDASHKLEALSALGALCESQSEHREQLLRDPENIRAITQVMRSFEQLPLAQAAGLKALFDRNTSLTNTKVLAMMNAGAGRCALRVVRVHSRRAKLVESALLGIAQISEAASQSERIAIRDAGAARAAIDSLVIHEQNAAIALASVTLLRALGDTISEGVAPGIIPRAVLSAMCGFRRNEQVHVAGLAVLRKLAEREEGAKRVAGAGAAQVVLTTMIEYRTKVEMQQSCVELLSQLVKLAGKENLECNCEDICKTVSGSVQVHWRDTSMMESTAKLLKLLRNKPE